MIHNTTKVTIADPKPINTFFCGLMVSSATLATPSMARKNQMANGMDAKMPEYPLGSAFCWRLENSNAGSVTPANINNSITARTVTTNSNEAASFTPKIFIAVKIR
ncbi:hypothetical protein D3C73_585920 [compost metagenome]